MAGINKPPLDIRLNSPSRVNSEIITEIHNILLANIKDHINFTDCYEVMEKATDIISTYNKTAEVYIKLTQCTEGLEDGVNDSSLIHFCSPECTCHLDNPELYTEINNYLKIKDLDVAPRLLQYGYLIIPNIVDRFSCKIIYMMTKKWGESLFDKYAKDLEANKNYLGPGIYSEVLLFSPKTFAEHFPSFLPIEIRNQVYDIVWLLYQNNIKLFDLHLGNFVEKDGLVKVIDMEDIKFIRHDPDLLVNNSFLKIVKILNYEYYWPDLISEYYLDLQLMKEAYQNGATDATEALTSLLSITDGYLYDELDEIYDFLVQCGADIKAILDFINDEFKRRLRRRKELTDFFNFLDLLNKVN